MKSTGFISILILSSWFYTNPLFPQRFRTDNEFVDYRLSTDQKKETNQQNKAFKEKLKDNNLQIASEGPIDPNNYVVGPGDIFTVSFGVGSPEDQFFTVSVSVDGTLFIPTLGGFDVRRKTLRETLALIKDRSRQKYDLSKIEFAAILTQPRLIKVHVLGQVTTPGAYIGSAVDKVTSFVQQADGFSDWAALDRIQIKHKNGTVDTIDLSRMYNNADLSQDAFLQGGDAIFVPPLEMTQGTVYVEGNADVHGVHQIITGETIEAFLYRIRAIDRSTNLNEIFLQRDEELIRLDFDSAGNNRLNASTAKLKAGDKLFLSYLKEYVYVHGAVRNPGYFPYFAGLKALDYAGLAGGTDEMGSLKRIEVYDSGTGIKKKGANLEVRRGDSVFVPFSYQARILKILKAAGYISSILIAAKAVGIINPNK